MNTKILFVQFKQLRGGYKGNDCAKFRSISSSLIDTFLVNANMFMFSEHFLRNQISKYCVPFFKI
jgi:hypothetical protein